MVLALLVLAASFAIAWPLWRFATADKAAYTAAVGIAVAALIAAWVGLSLRRRLRRRAVEAKAAGVEEASEDPASR